MGGWIEEDEAVGTSYWTVWVGGWVGERRTEVGDEFAHSCDSPFLDLLVNVVGIETGKDGLGGWVGGWVGYGKVEEIKAVRMSCCGK